MKKLFAIMAIAAAMMVAFCFQSAASCPVNDQAAQSAEVQMTAMAASYPSLSVTGGVYYARGRSQARVTVDNNTSSTVQCSSITASITHPTTGQPFSSESVSVTLSPGESQELFLNFTRVPGGISAGQTCKVVATGYCDGVTISSSPAYYQFK